MASGEGIAEGMANGEGIAEGMSVTEKGCCQRRRGVYDWGMKKLLLLAMAVVLVGCAIQAPIERSGMTDPNLDRNMKKVEELQRLRNP